MDEPSRPRDCYDLVKEDRRERFGTYKDIDIVLEQQQRDLNGYTHQIRLLWRENDTVMLITQLAFHLQDSTTPPREWLSRIDRPGRPDFRNRDGLNEVERLYRKRGDAKAFQQWLYEELEKITSHMLVMTPPPPPYGNDSGPTSNLFYRPIAKDARTFYSTKLGFCCDRVREHFNFSGPSKDDFLSHVKNAEMVAGSPYISLTDSPGCAYRRFKNWAHQVALIDYQKLRHMGIAVARTPHLAKTFKVPRDYDRMTEIDYLAEFWIPANCVIATLSWSAFEKVLIEHKIVDRRECLWQLVLEAGS
jgi:hypothetical protein